MTLLYRVCLLKSIKAPLFYGRKYFFVLTDNRQVIQLYNRIHHFKHIFINCCLLKAKTITLRVKGNNEKYFLDGINVL